MRETGRREGIAGEITVLRNAAGHWIFSGSMSPWWFSRLWRILSLVAPAGRGWLGL